MITYYHAQFNTIHISEIEIVSETPAFVTLKSGRREAKQSQYHAFHTSHEAAKSDILARLEEKRRTRQIQLEWVESEIEKANAL